MVLRFFWLYFVVHLLFFLFFFFFNDTATTEIYTLSLHDALPIWSWWNSSSMVTPRGLIAYGLSACKIGRATRLNSSHQIISYAVFCLKKKKKQHTRNNKQEQKKNNRAEVKTRVIT